MKHSAFKSSGSGRIIQAAVSRIQSATARSHNGVIQSGRNFHDTDSYGRDDLPLVAKLADQAHTFIFERLAELKSEQSE